MSSSLALLAIAAVGMQEPNLDREISLTRQAASLKQVAAGIAASTGIPVVVRDVESVPILASVSAKPLRQVLDRITEVADAQWAVSNGSITIFRSLPKAAQAREAFRLAEAKALQESIATFVKDNASAGDWSSEAVKKRIQDDLKLRSQMTPADGGRQGQTMMSFSNEGQRNSPVAAAMLELAKTIQVAKVLEIKEGEFAIFSTAANASQQPFPTDGVRVANAFLNANNAIASQAIDSQNTNQVTVETGFPLDAKKINRVSELLLRVTRQENQVVFRLVVVGENGLVLGQKTDMFACAPPTEAPAPLKMERVTPDAGYTDMVKRFGSNRPAMFISGVPLLSSVFSVRAVAADSSSGRMIVDSETDAGGGLAPVSMRDTFSNPATKEPWDVLLGDFLAGAAKASESDFVASFDDSYFLTMTPSFVGKQIAAETLAKALAEGRTNARVAEGWLIVKPQFASHAEESRISRPALDQVSKSLVRLGYPTLEAAADYIRRAPVRDGRASLDRAWLTATHTATEGWRPFGDWEYLKIFASLGSSQRAGNGAYAASTFSGPERSRLWRKALESGNDFMGGMYQMRIQMIGGTNPRMNAPEAAAIEPSELYPQGIPANLGLFIERRRNLAAYGTKGGDQGGEFRTANQLTGEIPKEFDGWQTGFQDAVMLRVGTDPRRGAGGGGTLLDFGITGGRVPFDGLPQAFHAQIADAKQREARQREAQKNAQQEVRVRGGRVGGGGGGS